MQEIKRITTYTDFFFSPKGLKVFIELKIKNYNRLLTIIIVGI